MRTCLGRSRCTEPWQCHILCPLAGIALTFSAFFDRLLSSAITIWGNKRKGESFIAPATQCRAVLFPWVVLRGDM